MADGSTRGSRFALLESSGSLSRHEKKVKKDRAGSDEVEEKQSKKEKKAKKERADSDDADEKLAKKEKKDKKDKADESKCEKQEKKEKKEKKDKRDRKKDAEAFHVIILTQLRGDFDRYPRKDCQAAADWLGMDFNVDSFCNKPEVPGASATFDILNKFWPRMLKHMAAAIEEDLVDLNVLAELWQLGYRLDGDDIHCDEAATLQAALETRFEQDEAFREEVLAIEAQQKAQCKVKGPPPDIVELQLSEDPLDLFGKPPFRSPAPHPAETILWDDARRSFAFRYRGLLSDQEETRHFFEGLRDYAPWCELGRRDGSVKRSTAWYVRGGCACTYTYSFERVSMPAGDSDLTVFNRLMEELTERIFELTRPDWGQDCWPNCANLNLYATGEQAVGWHADDESLFMGRDDDCVILSLSLGATREFWLAPNGSVETGAPRPNLKAVSWVKLEDGDLMTMEGMCQKHYVHCVPVKHGSGPRVNVTWRWIREHKRQCPLTLKGKSKGRRKGKKGKGKGKDDAKGKKDENGKGKGNPFGKQGMGWYREDSEDDFLFD
eukprot:TRINITY_DN8948_c0_g1_i1.p1 TRINITY_DN8948_c0_g1~~TRINITY_DN8948_c0_g1_i1.p1  ORF type:complete len:569 (-),score=140.56 TRINITY_DN8948_c0_g1_i1:26-1675(-)